MESIIKKVINLPPGFRYKGGYVKINKCTGCGTIGYYKDIPELFTCGRCQSVVMGGMVGKWVYTTVLVKKKWYQFWKTKFKQVGRWVIK